MNTLRGFILNNSFCDFFFKQIKRNIDEKHARLYQTLNEGKQLVASVSCPELEGQITKLEEQWLALNKKIDHELHRLQTLLKHLLRYVFLGMDCAQISMWRKTSEGSCDQPVFTCGVPIVRFFVNNLKHLGPFSGLNGISGL